MKNFTDHIYNIQQIIFKYKENSLSLSSLAGGNQQSVDSKHLSNSLSIHMNTRHLQSYLHHKKEMKVKYEGKITRSTISASVYFFQSTSKTRLQDSKIMQLLLCTNNWIQQMSRDKGIW